MRRLKALALIFVLACVSACEAPPSDVTIFLTARDNQGQAVADANVRINGEGVGTTDANGHLKRTVSLVPKTTAQVEVKKDSSTFYYAPSFHTFEVEERKLQDVRLAATLYFVPKPSPEDAARLAAEDAAVNQPETAATETPPTPVTEETTEETSAVAEADASGTLMKVVPAEPTKAEPAVPQTYLFTLHVTNGGKALAGAEVHYGEISHGQLTLGCTSNERGRCLIKFKGAPNGPVTFIVKKRGFHTRTINARVAHKGIYPVKMNKGETLDLFAVNKLYHYTRGLSGVQVFIQGRAVGETDRFGHFSHNYTGAKGDLLEVTLKAKDHLPAEFTTDFIVSGPMNLVRYFMPAGAPPASIALLPARAAGDMAAAEATNINSDLDETLSKAATKYLFASGVFREVAEETLTSELTPERMIKDGWFNTALKGSLDALLLPTVVIGEPSTVELSLIDSKGQVLAAAKDRLGSVTDKGAIDQAVRTIASQLLATFPFEGAIIAKNGDQVTINMGQTGHALKPGYEFEIYGLQSDKTGREQQHARIGRLRIETVAEKTSEATILENTSRAMVDIGDLVVLKTRHEVSETSVQIKVSGLLSGKEEAVAQANVYIQDRWVGATDANGRLYMDKAAFGESGLIKVLKHGYRDFTRDVQLSAVKRLDVKLVRETAFLRVESEPAGATVTLEGKVLGKTPLASPIPVPTGFVKLELKGASEFKTHTAIFDLAEGTLDLTGSRRIQLERDLIPPARRLLDAGKFMEAAKHLEEVPSSHSDALLARHMAGEIYLTRLDRPADAARLFGNVTEQEAVKNFSDKRFIGTHVNEGIALFHTAEKLAPSDPTTAAAHYQKALAVLGAVTPQLRFVPAEQFDQAVHNVGYHKALAAHKLWSISQERTTLENTLRLWREYLEQVATEEKSTDETKAFVENAGVFLKQAQASYEAGSKTTEKM